MQNLPSYLEVRTLRDHIDRLPTLSLDHLKTEAEQRRAYLILTFFVHAYVWGGDVPAEVLPPSVSIPLLQVSDALGLPPVATFASLNLWNFTTTNESFDFTDVDSLQAQHTFTGTQDESWFYMVSVAIEAQGAYIIPILLQGLDSLQQLYPINSHSPEISPEEQSHVLAAATNALNDLTACIAKLGKLLERMYHKCDPNVFYHRIRPFLAGSKNMAAAGLPRGVFYDQGNGRGEWQQLRGGSNGQSSLIQFLDIALGVEHSSSGNSDPEGPDAADSFPDEHNGLSEKTKSFHQEVRGYMPRKHREFLEYVTQLGGGGGFRSAIGQLLAHNSGASAEPELADLKRAFRTATKALAEFRNKHLQLVTRYIVIPSRQHQQRLQQEKDGHGQSQEANKGSVVNLANATLSATIPRDGGVKPEATHHAELTGTGGTALLPFLKQSRDETFQAGEMSTFGAN